MPFELTLVPQRGDVPLAASSFGDRLILNGVVYDFTPLPEGATLPRAAVQCDWLASDVERIGGVLHLSLIIPHGSAASHKTLFPEPIRTVDGPIPLPPYEETADAD